MQTFRIRQQEIWDTYTLVEAENVAEAIAKVKDGQGDLVHSEYNRQNEAFESCEESRAVPALYILEPIGLHFELEAVDCLRFCCEGCRTIVAENTERSYISFGMCSDWIPGTVCDECGIALG